MGHFVEGTSLCFMYKDEKDKICLVNLYFTRMVSDTFGMRVI